MLKRVKCAPLRGLGASPCARCHQLEAELLATRAKYDPLVDTLLAMVERAAREHSEPKVRAALLYEASALRAHEVAALRGKP
jgi:methylphosphotriester-DNA--protein-cysteine methyltransferase